jgi:hypothetical protein
VGGLHRYAVCEFLLVFHESVVVKVDVWVESFFFMLVSSLDYDSFDFLSSIFIRLTQPQRFIDNRPILYDFPRLQPTRSSDYNLGFAVINPVGQLWRCETPEDH